MKVKIKFRVHQTVNITIPQSAGDKVSSVFSENFRSRLRASLKNSRNDLGLEMYLWHRHREVSYKLQTRIGWRSFEFGVDRICSFYIMVKIWYLPNSLHPRPHKTHNVLQVIRTTLPCPLRRKAAAGSVSYPLATHGIDIYTHTQWWIMWIKWTTNIRGSQEDTRSASRYSQWACRCRRR